MKPVRVIAAQEFANGLRNRWAAASVGAMVIFSLALALLGSAPAGTTGAAPLTVVVVSLASLSVFLLPLIALLLAHDAVVGEAERGTLLLTLSYPVARWHLLAGKFLGHLAILALAAGLGYAAAGVAVTAGRAIPEAGSLAALAELFLTAVLLGAVFLALGYAVSALVKERATAVGIAVGLWLLFVIVYDLVFLGLLVAVSGLPHAAVTALILLNPTDVFRLINLTGSEAAVLASGVSAAGSKVAVGRDWLYATLIVWLLAGLGVSWLTLRRKEL